MCAHFGTTSSERELSSQGASSSDASEFVYVAPLGSTVAQVKKLSAFSCACAIGAGPLIISLGTSSAMGNVGIAGTLASFGMFTTGLLYWFTKPYVLRLEHVRGSPSARVTTATLVGTPQSQTIRMADIRPVDSVHPLSSFQAGGRVFYIDPNAVRDPEMLALFAPQGSEVEGGAEPVETLHATSHGRGPVGPGSARAEL